MKNIAPIAIFGLALTTSSVNAQEIFRQDESWAVTANRSISACAAHQKVPAISGGLAIWKSTSGLTISVEEAKLSWVEDGKFYDATMVIDRRRWHGKLEAVRSPESGAVRIANPAQPFLEAVRQGSMLYLMIDGATYGPYSLRGTSKVFQDLADCFAAVTASVQLSKATDIVDPAFNLTNDRLQRADTPDQFIKIGETVSLKDLGRRFPDAAVSAAYEQGDEEIEYYKVKHGQAEASLFYEDGGKINRIDAHTSGIADANGVQIGGSASAALGARAYCNTFREDETAFCQKAKGAGLKYSIEADDATCPFPQAQEGVFTIPACLKVTGMSAAAP